MAQVYPDGDSKKLQPLTVPKIVEQLEKALMEIKYSQNRQDNEMAFNQTQNVPLNPEKVPGQFIGKELMLFEMMGILNGKISELEKKYEKLRSLEEKENYFVEEKSHEISNPVQQIIDYAVKAKSGEISQEDAVEKMADAAQKLQNITTVVLDSNRIENNSLRLTQDKVNVNELISDAVSIVRSSEHKVPIRVGLDHEIEILADKARLSQVIQTILNNALEYTEQGQVKVESFVALDHNVVIIRISDTGKGIAPGILPIIFDKVDSDSDVRLNLYLCKGIIEAHGGNITAKNNDDVGATFTITIPINKD